MRGWRGIDRRVRIALVVSAAAALLVGGALLTRGGSGGSGGLFRGSSGTESQAGTSAPDGTGPSGHSKTGTSTIIGRDHVQQEVAPRPSGAEPATDGAALTTVTAPPPKTISALSTSAATPGSEYDVTVRVYGYGPSTGIASIVVLVQTSVPRDTSAKAYDLNGRNVLVRLDPDTQQVMTVGGTYSGTIKLRLTGDALVPWFDDVRAGS